MYISHLTHMKILVIPQGCEAHPNMFSLTTYAEASFKLYLQFLRGYTSSVGGGHSVEGILCSPLQPPSPHFMGPARIPHCSGIFTALAEIFPYFYHSCDMSFNALMTLHRWTKLFWVWSSFMV